METLDRLQAVYAKWDKAGPRTNGVASHNGHQDYSRVVNKGRQAWQNKFVNSDLQAPRSAGHRNRRSRNDGIPDLPVNTQLANLAFFKWKPTILPQSDQFRRVFMGRCCSCMPNSKNEFLEEHMESEGLHNILDVDTKRKRGLQGIFHHISFCLMRDVSHKYPRVSMKVLSHPRVIQAIQLSVNQAAEAEEKTADSAYMKSRLKQEKRRAESLVRRLSANVSNIVIRLTGYVLHKVLPLVYNKIIVHRGKINMVKQAIKTGVPVIYLPTHRSHMDYIFMTFTLFNFDMQAPYVAAGDNLLIPVFGTLMRKLNGFFIRRKLDHKSGKKDLTYRAILHTYMEELLRRGETMEFFLEGGRSRSGKLLPPKSGLLSVVVQAYLDGAIPDAYLIPVSFSYERLLEGNFNDELMGEQKTAESFLSVVRATWQVIRSRFGNVRIEFAQPFSLKEYLQVSQGYSHPNDSLSQWETVTSPMGISSKFDSNCSLFGVEEHRNTVQSLAEHVLYNCMSIQAVMSTHLLAFLLLTKHRQGVELSRMEDSISWLREELTSRHRDVGFCGKARDVIMHAAELLGPGLVTITRKDSSSSEDLNNNDGDAILLTPNLELPNIFELNYYANVINSIYAVDAVIATAVCSLAGDRLWLRSGMEGFPTVNRSSLLQRAIDLCHIFQFEFIFKPPCTSWMQVFNEAIDQLVINEILVTIEEQHSTWNRRLSHRMRLHEDSDEEEEDMELDATYTVQTEGEHSVETMRFLVSVIAPLVEVYHITVCNALSLKQGQQSEKDFFKMVHNKLKQRVAQNITVYGESTSCDTLRNAIRCLRTLRVLEVTQEGATSMLGVHSSTEAVSRLDQMLDILDSCRVSDMV